MTLSEFKAWFEGFTESIEGKSAPTQKQWARIKEKVALIDGAPTTQVVYLDRWVRPYRDYWDRFWVSAGGSGGATWGGAVGGQTGYYLNAVGRSDGIGVANAATYAAIDPATKGDSQTVEFNSHAAMRDLGRMEAVA